MLGQIPKPSSRKKHLVCWVFVVTPSLRVRAAFAQPRTGDELVVRAETIRGPASPQLVLPAIHCTKPKEKIVEQHEPEEKPQPCRVFLERLIALKAGGNGDEVFRVRALQEQFRLYVVYCEVLMGSTIDAPLQVAHRHGMTDLAIPMMLCWP